MKKINLFAIALLLISYALLIPGISKPLMTLTGTVDKAELVELGKQLVATNPDIMPMIGGMAIKLLDTLNVTGEIQAYEKTRSILGTVKELFDSKNYLVSFLVMLFSVVVPVIKGTLLLVSTWIPEISIKERLVSIASLISKWSMADVFVVAVIVAYLAANASSNMGEIFTLNATLGSGFYFFLGYCLLSLLSAQLMALKTSKFSKDSNN
jgi:uncharacterized paraquat-inducible protein A